MKKTVLICGASGFLGFNLLQKLSQRQDLDIYGTYNSNRYNRIDKDSPRLIRADLTQKTNVDKILSETKPDVIIQTAANSSGSKDDVERPEIHVTPNVAINNWLISAAHEYGVKQFIFPSCTIMYPNRDEPSTENNLDLNRDFSSPAYFGGAWMKIFAEKQCEFFSRRGKTKFSIIRHSNIYGPYDRFEPDKSHVFAATIRKVANAENGSKLIVWGQGKEVRDFLGVSDFVRFVELVIDKQDYEFGLFNLSSEEPISISELVKKTIMISGKNLEIQYDPKGPAIGNKALIDCSKAKEKFNWKPIVSLNEGIEKTLEWYSENIKPR